MHISSSTIGMESARSYTSTTTRSVYFSIGRGQLSLGNQTVGGGKNGIFGETPNDKNQNSTSQSQDRSATEGFEELRAKLNGFSTRLNTNLQTNIKASRNTSISTSKTSSIGEQQDPFGQLRTIRDQCVNFLYELLVGGRNRSSWNMGYGGQNMPLYPIDMSTLEYGQSYQFTESETTAYSAQGKVVCGDGREIDFNMDLMMSRSFEAQYQEQIQALPTLCDPLVINLEGNIADLSDQRFLFDIDGDGTKDEISRLGAGSGYLALDKNQDGTINDGSELFGTASGNGFADLARYDSDGNGWIDEGDAIWSQLKVWAMDENGNSQLYSLTEKGVGAICLSNAATDFALTNDTNEVKGVIRKTGMFLYENGAVGSVQHVDVAKYDSVS